MIKYIYNRTKIKMKEAGRCIQNKLLLTDDQDKSAVCYYYCFTTKYSHRTERESSSAYKIDEIASINNLLLLMIWCLLRIVSAWCLYFTKKNMNSKKQLINMTSEYQLKNKNYVFWGKNTVESYFVWYCSWTDQNDNLDQKDKLLRVLSYIST